MIDFRNLEVLTLDCYGTLIDWETGILDTVLPFLNRHGVNVSQEEVLELYAQFESVIEGHQAFQKYRKVLRGVIKRFGEHFHFQPTEVEVKSLEESLKGWPPFPDTVEALQMLRRRFKLAIISNIDRDLFAKTARVLRLDPDWLITSEEVGVYKPSLKNFTYAITKISIPGHRILHVTQSLYHDIVPAQRIGLAMVWVNRRKGRKGTGATPPASARPDLEVPDLKRLVSVIGI